MKKSSSPVVTAMRGPKARRVPASRAALAPARGGTQERGQRGVAQDASAQPAHDRMRGHAWRLVLDIGARDASALPLFVRIANAITLDITRGRLTAGRRLPGSRTLAAELGVNRNTVVAAYRELCAQGWISGDSARGTFVRARLDEAALAPARRKLSRAVEPSFAMPALHDARFGPLTSPYGQVEPPRGTLLLIGGRPDARLFPVELLARAYRRALRQDGARLLDYAEPHGHPRLRAALAEMLSATRSLATVAQDVLVTRGSQMALHLASATLLERGDAVAVEAFGYPPAWAAMRAQGAELFAVNIDAEGMRICELEALHERRPLRAVYVTPHHQYATLATLSPARRLQLLDFARRARVAIIEDDYDHEFHYEGRPVPPLASQDRSGSVVYVGSLSKVLSPGLRIGYVVAARTLLERMARMRRFIDRQGDSVTEAALAELMEDGEVQRHIYRTRRIYRARRDTLVAALQRELGERVRFTPPPGGIALWLHAPGVDVDAWAARAAQRGVIFVPGRACAFDGKRQPYARLGFARLHEAEIDKAVRRMAETLRGAKTWCRPGWRLLSAGPN